MISETQPYLYGVRVREITRRTLPARVRWFILGFLLLLGGGWMFLAVDPIESKSLPSEEMPVVISKVHSAAFPLPRKEETQKPTVVSIQNIPNHPLVAKEISSVITLTEVSPDTENSDLIPLPSIEMTPGVLTDEQILFAIRWAGAVSRKPRVDPFEIPLDFLPLGTRITSVRFKNQIQGKHYSFSDRELASILRLTPFGIDLYAFREVNDGLGTIQFRSDDPETGLALQIGSLSFRGGKLTWREIPGAWGRALEKGFVIPSLKDWAVIAFDGEVYQTDPRVWGDAFFQAIPLGKTEYAESEIIYALTPFEVEASRNGFLRFWVSNENPKSIDTEHLYFDYPKRLASEIKKAFQEQARMDQEIQAKTDESLTGNAKSHAAAELGRLRQIRDEYAANILEVLQKISIRREYDAP